MTGRTSLLSFAEAIALVRQRLNASSGRAAEVVREALKSGELRIIRDDHIDPISGSLFAIVEEDFLDWLNRQVSTTATTPLAARKQPDRERGRGGSRRIAKLPDLLRKPSDVGSAMTRPMRPLPLPHRFP
jgi:hypothetical protein